MGVLLVLVGFETVLFCDMFVASLSVTDVFTPGLGGRGGGSIETVPFRVAAGCSTIGCGLAGSAGRNSPVN